MIDFKKKRHVFGQLQACNAIVLYLFFLISHLLLQRFKSYKKLT